MAINSRAKGQNGEREIATALNNVVIQVREHCGLPTLAKEDLPFQRNQNQSAVGGSDLSNPFKLCIEVKRQEVLAVNTWWQQCLGQAKREQGQAVLIYRQNNKPWRVRMLGFIALPTVDGEEAWRTNTDMAVEISYEEFIEYFHELYIQVVTGIGHE